MSAAKPRIALPKPPYAVWLAALDSWSYAWSFHHPNLWYICFRAIALCLHFLCHKTLLQPNMFPQWPLQDVAVVLFLLEGWTPRKRLNNFLTRSLGCDESWHWGAWGGWGGGVLTVAALAHMFDAMQVHCLRYIWTFCQCARMSQGYVLHLLQCALRMFRFLCWCYASWSCTNVWYYGTTWSSVEVNGPSMCTHVPGYVITMVFDTCGVGVGCNDIVELAHMFDAT